MNVRINRHFDQCTPLDEGQDDEERKWILCLRYPRAASQFEVDATALANLIDEMRPFEAWKLIGFDTLGEFCQAKLGQSIEVVESVVSGVRSLISSGRTGKISAADAVAAAKETPAPGHGGDRKSKDRDQGCNATLKRGTADHWLARLARDSSKAKEPETRELCARLLDAVSSGELSVHQAAIQAGYRKRKTHDELSVNHFRKAENRLAGFKANYETLDENRLPALKAILETLDEQELIWARQLMND